MKSVIVPISPAMRAALQRLACARARVRQGLAVGRAKKHRGRSPGELEDILRETPVQSASPDKKQRDGFAVGLGQSRKVIPAPGREDTGTPAQLEGLENARSADVFTFRCKD